MLRELPIVTIGDVARLSLELHVYCPRCFAARKLDVGRPELAARPIARSRFRCSFKRAGGAPCDTIGVPKVRPAELLQVGGPVTLAFLTCPRCVWEIDQVQLDKPPWSGADRRYRCPGCSGEIQWHIHGPAWRPGQAVRAD